MTRHLFALLLTTLIVTEASAIALGASATALIASSSASKNKTDRETNPKNILAQNSDSASGRELVEQGEGLSQQQMMTARLGAIAKWEEARLIWQREGNLEQEAATLIKLGEAYYNLDATTLAQERYSEALALVRQLGERPLEALILGQLGRIYQANSNFNAGLNADRLRFGSDYGLSSVQSRLSDVLREKSFSDRDKATESYQQALEIYQDLNSSSTTATFASRQGEARLLNQLGKSRYGSGTSEYYESIFQRALEIYQEIGDKKGEAVVLSNLSEFYFFGSSDERAGLELFNQAQTLYQNISASSEEDRNWAKKREALLLINTMVRYWWRENRATALEFHEQALSLSREIGDRQVEALILENLGYLFGSNPQKELEFYQQALGIYEELGDVVKQGVILSKLGIRYRLLGEQSKALEFHSQELKISDASREFYTQLGDSERALDYRYRQPIILGKIGRIYGELEEVDNEVEQYQRGREIYRTLNDPKGEATFLIAIAEQYGYAERQEEMLTFLEQAVQVYQEAGDREGEAEILNKIATVYIYQFGDFDRGLNLFEQALSIYQEVGNRTEEARILSRIAKVYEEELDEKEKAIKFYNRRVLIDRELGESSREVDNFRTIARLHYELGDRATALEVFEQAARVYQEPEDLAKEARSLVEIAEDYIKLEEPEIALEFYQRATPLYQELEDYHKETLYLRRMAEIHYELDNVEKAIALFAQARQVYQDNNDRSGEAWTLYQTGITYTTLGDLEKALESYEEAVEVYDREPDASNILDIFLRASRIYAYSGEAEKAKEFCDRAVVSAREFLQSQQMRMAEVFREIGKVCYQVGDTDKALVAFNTYRQHYQSIGKREEIIGLIRIGEDYAELGDIEQALEFFNRAQLVYRENDFPEEEINTLNRIAYIYSRSGDYPQAFDFYTQALTLARQINNSQKEVDVLSRLGEVYEELGDEEKALASYQNVLQLYQNLESPGGEVDALEKIASLYEKSKNLEKALEAYSKALAISQENGIPNGTTNWYLTKMGQFHYQLGNLNQALTFFNQISAKGGANSFVYVQLGKVYSDLGDLDKALEAFNKFLTLSDNDYPERRAEGLFGIAVVERKRGNLDIALTRIEAAIALIEAVRAKKDSPEQRQTFFATKQEYYEFYIDLLMELHQQNPTKSYDAQALNINERSRARSLLELLAEANTDIRKGVDPELVLQERRLQQQLDALDQREVTLNRSESTREQVITLQQERQYLLNQYQALQGKIRQESPSYAALTQPQPVTLEQIQQQILDDHTLVLQYELGEKRSYVWAITKDSLTSYALPSRQVIEQKARQFRNNLVRLRDRRQPQKAIASGRELNALILQPLKDYPQKKRLVIVADGALHYIPFSALPNPGRKNVSSRLVEAYELVHLPSLSTLAILRQDLAQRQKAPQQLVAIADPVFSTNDPRLQNDSASPDSNPISLLPRAVEDVGIQLERLPGTRSEAEAIATLVPESQRLQIFDFAANHHSIVNTPLNQYRTIHFATHGILNSVNPELSGLVLSLVDEQGNPRNGFLRLHDIYNLDLAADLVVLSACKTGLGKEIQGEGLVGLTRGFMYAGTPRILVSLWNVDDAATAEMMTRFYRLMWQEKLSPPEALREAQLEMQKETQWTEPFYWAAFTLQGEWEAIE
ncbi:MAG: tetratricopeptide repeat protein [Oscillatoria sp. PMC 1068.18]|nr:tetratricopeptide repeat protein [Oscillatoria sp. PMC 1076.18]MEC4987282.1 tetratricopeptide repeat protein [Oscillatoria sp. PMC 1068.18]